MPFYVILYICKKEEGYLINRKGSIMEKFNISKVTNSEQAIQEMDYQYEKMQGLNSSNGRAGRFYNMLALYEKFPVLKTIWMYVEEAYQYTKKFVKLIITKIADMVKSVGHDYFYIMRFYKNGRHAFDKVGSSNDVMRRQRQHMDYYVGSVDKCDILLCVDTGTISASSLEDKVRSYFIRKYGEKRFLPKDRFRCQVDIEDIKNKIPACLDALRAAEIM